MTNELRAKIASIYELVNNGAKVEGGNYTKQVKQAQLLLN
jgi:hypothetical protein